MDSIYKYVLEVDDVQTLVLPKSSTILTVQTQNNKPCIWAIVDLDTDETEERHILTFGTGHAIEDDIKVHYIGTYQIYDGAQVYHVFEDLR